MEWPTHAMGWLSKCVAPIYIRRDISIKVPNCITRSFKLISSVSMSFYYQSSKMSVIQFDAMGFDSIWLYCQYTGKYTPASQPNAISAVVLIVFAIITVIIFLSQPLSITTDQSLGKRDVTTIPSPKWWFFFDFPIEFRTISVERSYTTISPVCGARCRSETLLVGHGPYFWHFVPATYLSNANTRHKRKRIKCKTLTAMLARKWIFSEFAAAAAACCCELWRSFSLSHSIGRYLCYET